MTTRFTRLEPARPAVAALRAATRNLHEALHRHPLIEELLTRPTYDCYQTVLKAFLTFYRPLEDALVKCARRLELAEHYPRAMRTGRLIADLKSLGCEVARLAGLTDHPSLPKLTCVGELVGCLYVVNGSALGGRTILKQLAGGLAVQRSCRFFTGEGSDTAASWRKFTRFCDQTCRCEETRRLAILAAQQTFASIADCLTIAMNERGLHTQPLS